MIVHKGGVVGEPWAVSWSTLKQGWCDTLGQPRFQPSRSVPKNKIASKDVKMSKLWYLAHGAWTIKIKPKIISIYGQTSLNFSKWKILKNAFNLKFVRTSSCFQKAKICSVTSLEQKKRMKTINFMTYKYACCFESVVLSAMKFISAVFQMKTVAYLQLSY